MSTVEKTPEVDAQILSEREAVYRHAFEGAPLDPEIAKRVREHTQAITERVRREHGMVDVVQLVRDSRP
jgi:hypothetical protein